MENLKREEMTAKEKDVSDRFLDLIEDLKINAGLEPMEILNAIEMTISDIKKIEPLNS